MEVGDTNVSFDPGSTQGLGAEARALGFEVRDVAAARIYLIESAAPPEEESPPEGPSVYGPGAYAGPGSLGGTESAIRR